MIAGLFLSYARSLRFAESRVCGRCGLRVDARATGGTSGFTSEFVCSPPNSSPFKLVAVLTHGGNLSISCGCSLLEKPPSEIPSGESVGTSYLAKNHAPGTREIKHRTKDGEPCDGWIAIGNAGSGNYFGPCEICGTGWKRIP